VALVEDEGDEPLPEAASSGGELDPLALSLTWAFDEFTSMV
jgi:hypothetical protein